MIKNAKASDFAKSIQSNFQIALYEDQNYKWWLKNPDLSNTLSRVILELLIHENPLYFYEDLITNKHITIYGISETTTYIMH